MIRFWPASAAIVLALGTFPSPSPQPATHRLEATPATVAYGFYWSEAKPALRMVNFLVAAKGLDALAAYQLTSVAGNVAITQLVDQKVGVHVKMPKGIFEKTRSPGK
jgi:acetamidase/formamidase